MTASGSTGARRGIVPRTAALIAILLLAALIGLLTWGWEPGAPAIFDPPPIRVRAIGHNWWWEFEYPDSGIRTANELHLPAGRRVLLEVSSADVAHTLSIPELGVQANGLKEQTVRVEVPAVVAGEYGGDCSQVCGLAHNMMRVKVVVQAPEDFEAWTEGQRMPATAPQTEQQRRGYEMVTTACATCHSLDPAEQNAGLAGPNLAHLMSRSVFAGATFELNQTTLRRWLRDTQEMKPGNVMVVKLPRDDYEAVIEYLLMLK